VTANPFIRLFEQPVESLTAGGYVLLLVAALVATWWAGGRNALYLDEHYQDGWRYLVPFWYAIRLAGMLVIVAIDLWLLAGIIHTLT